MEITFTVIKEDEMKFVKVPKDFECSITHEIMVNPAITDDGETYDWEAIEDWLKTHDTSPNTNEVLTDKRLRPNRKLKSQIYDFIAQNKADFERELIEAVKGADAILVQLILKLGISPNIQDEQGWTPLHHAAKSGQLQLLFLLIKHNAKLNQATARIVTVYEEKLLKERLELQKKEIENSRLQKKAELDRQRNEVKNKIDNLLNEEQELIRYLKALREFIPQAEAEGNKFNIFNSSNRDFAYAFYYLIDTSSNPWSQAGGYFKINPHCLTAPETACKRQELSNKYKELQAQMNFFNNILNTQPNLIENQKQVLRKGLEKLNKEEAEVKEAIKQMYHVNVVKEQIAKVEKILHELPMVRAELVAKYIGLVEAENQTTIPEDNPPPIKAEITRNATPIQLAVYHGHIPFCQALIESGMDIHERDAEGWTLLHWAVINHQVEMFRYLLEQGVDPEIKDKNNDAAIDIARELNDAAMVDLLQSLIREKQALNASEPIKQNSQTNRFEEDISAKMNSMQAMIFAQAEQIKALKRQVQQLTNLINNQPLQRTDISDNSQRLSTYNNISFISQLGQQANSGTSQAPANANEEISAKANVAKNTLS